MEDKIPRDIVYRPKKGFGAPVGVWLRGGLLPLLKEKLSRERIAKQGIFTPAIVDKLVLEHESGRRDNRKELWTLLMFQLWYDAWYD
jgi:asparagine synthase (glutamine-hydrolysing)